MYLLVDSGTLGVTEEILLCGNSVLFKMIRQHFYFLSVLIESFWMT
jgi:hypothetical protein